MLAIVFFSVSRKRSGDGKGIYLFLFNELGVWAVVHDIRPKDRRGQLAIDLLSIDILQLPIENELIPIRSEIHSGLLPQEDECEDIPMLVVALRNELLYR